MFVKEGLHYTINTKPKRFPVREYFKIQGRFQHLTDADLDVIQKMVDEDWGAPAPQGGRARPAAARRAFGSRRKAHGEEEEKDVPALGSAPRAPLFLLSSPYRPTCTSTTWWRSRGEEVRLKAETRGTLFIRGGEIVEFFVDDIPLGKNLSGGDGVAYRPTGPHAPGSRKSVPCPATRPGGLPCWSRSGARGSSPGRGGRPASGGLHVSGSPGQQAGGRIAGKPASPGLPSDGRDAPEGGPRLARSKRICRRAPSALGRRRPVRRSREEGPQDPLRRRRPGGNESALKHKPQCFSFEPAKGAVSSRAGKSWRRR